MLVHYVTQTKNSLNISRQMPQMIEESRDSPSSTNILCHHKEQLEYFDTNV